VLYQIVTSLLKATEYAVYIFKLIREVHFVHGFCNGTQIPQFKDICDDFRNEEPRSGVCSVLSHV
jgi:hypothetical protein